MNKSFEVSITATQDGEPAGVNSRERVSALMTAAAQAVAGQMAADLSAGTLQSAAIAEEHFSAWLSVMRRQLDAALSPHAAGCKAIGMMFEASRPVVTVAEAERDEGGRLLRTVTRQVRA